MVVESGHIIVGWTHEAHARVGDSASLFSCCERQMRRRSAGEYLSGRVLVRLLPRLEP